MDKKVMAIAIAAVMVIAGCSAFFVLKDNNEEKSKLIDNLAETGNYLKIFGNADGDYRINQNDVDTIQKYIDGDIEEKDLIKVMDSDDKKTYYLADANLDGVVDSKDIDTLKGIIDRTNETFALIDTFGHLCKVPMNVERIACDYFATAELLQLVGVQDKIVGASNAICVLKDYYLQGADMTKVVNFNARTGTNTDYENLEKAHPQVWVVSEDYGSKYKGNTSAVVVGLDTLIFDFDNIYASSPIQSALLAGYIFNNTEKAVEYVNWYLETWNMLYDKTKDLTNEQRPTVFYSGVGQSIQMKTDGSHEIAQTSTKTIRIFLSNTVCWQAVKLAGGRNIIDDCKQTLTPSARPTANVNMDIEWISSQTYDYLFLHCTKYTGSGNVSATVPDHGFKCDDPTEYKTAQESLKDIKFLNYGCKSENMYLTPGDFMNGASGGLMSAIMVATVIHADLFPDLDLLDEFQKYIDMMGFDFNVHEHGTFFIYNE